MSIKKLNVETAQIKTASVEVKTLTISGKQVTLAVFRQLPDESLIDFNTLQLAGIPWGRINYHPDKCSTESQHIHIVWQKGQCLYRSHTEKSLIGHWTPTLVQLNSATRSFSAIEFLEGEKNGWWEYSSFSEESQKTVKIGQWTVTLQIDRRKAQEIRKGVGTRQEVLQNILIPALREHDEYLAKYAELYEQLMGLDQLYIAV